MQTCAICYEDIKINKRTKLFVCKKCTTSICKECFKQILDSGSYVPTCPTCRRTLNYNDIIEVTSKTYFKVSFIDHLTDISFKIWTEQLIQNIYPLIYKIDENINAGYGIIDKIASTYYEKALRRLDKASTNKFEFDKIFVNLTNDALSYISANPNIDEYEINKIFDVLDTLCRNEALIEFYTNNFNLSGSLFDVKNELDKLNKSKDKSITYLFKCEKCKFGRITDKYVCDICKCKFCDKCLKDLNSNSEHVCKDEDILSFNEIVENTKPCPKCSTRIFKISGCSQMFCTNCHVGFDWNTGKIINGQFHNPHRNEWLKNKTHFAGFNAECVTDIANIELTKETKYQNLLSYHNEIMEYIIDLERDLCKANEVDYYSILRNYYSNSNLFVEGLSNASLKAIIKQKEISKFKISTLLTTLTPIADLIHDGLAAILEVRLSKVNDEYDGKLSYLNSELYGNPTDLENEIYNNLIDRLIDFDDELYMIEPIIEQNINHYIIEEIPFNDKIYSFNPKSHGFKTIYNLIDIINSLTVKAENINPEFSKINKNSISTAERYIRSSSNEAKQVAYLRDYIRKFNENAIKSSIYLSVTQKKNLLTFM